MTVKQLRDQLNTLMEHGLSPGSKVIAYNGDSEQMEPVTGLLYDNNTTEISTDDDG